MLRVSISQFQRSALFSSASSSSMLRRGYQSSSRATALIDLSSTYSFLAPAASALHVCATAGMFSATQTLLKPNIKSKNPYKVLGIPQGADVKTIKKAHRAMSMRYHPDVPGGSHEDFQRIQEAYEQVKSGTWVPRADDPESKNNSTARWQGFRYKTASRDSASFEDVMKDMHSKASASSSASDAAAGAEGAAAADGAEGPEGAAKKPRFNPQDIRIQAWFRLLTAWAVVFLVLRVAFFLAFPPKVEKKHRPSPAALNKNLQKDSAAAAVKSKSGPPPPARLPATPQAI
jgi:hypothetical protein